ncbi:MAG: hypothetical protein RIR91_662 [Verrucomicrobiota bacterium]
MDVDAPFAERGKGVDGGIPATRQAGEREQRRSAPSGRARRREEVAASERGETEKPAGRRQGRDFFPFARSFVVHAFLLRMIFPRVNLTTMDKG